MPLRLLELHRLLRAVMIVVLLAQSSKTLRSANTARRSSKTKRPQIMRMIRVICGPSFWHTNFLITRRVEKLNSIEEKS